MSKYCEIKITTDGPDGSTKSSAQISLEGGDAGRSTVQTQIKGADGSLTDTPIRMAAHKLPEEAVDAIRGRMNAAIAYDQKHGGKLTDVTDTCPATGKTPPFKLPIPGQ